MVSELPLALLIRLLVKRRKLSKGVSFSPKMVDQATWPSIDTRWTEITLQ